MSIFKILKQLLAKPQNQSATQKASSNSPTTSTDLVYFSSNKLCPHCSIYNRRVFSRSGKDKRFPPLAKLPKDLHSVNCPVCESFISLSNYHAINVDGKLKLTIQESNRPFVDIRTIEEKQLYEEKQSAKLLKIQNKKEYAWLCEKSPDIAPKSLSGYSRMKNSNSANYQKLLSLMKEKGFEIG